MNECIYINRKFIEILFLIVSNKKWMWKEKAEAIQAMTMALDILQFIPDLMSAFSVLSLDFR